MRAHARRPPEAFRLGANGDAPRCRSSPGNHPLSFETVVLKTSRPGLDEDGMRLLGATRRSCSYPDVSGFVPKMLLHVHADVDAPATRGQCVPLLVNHTKTF